MESETEALWARAEALETLMNWPSFDSAEAVPADEVLRAVKAKLAAIRKEPTLKRMATADLSVQFRSSR